MRRQRPPSRSDVTSAAPARAPLVVIRAHCASAIVATATMPWSPLRRPAVDPPSLLGPLPPVGRRQRQHGNFMVVPGNPGPRQRCRDDDARPSWSSPSSIGIVGVRCGWVVFVFVGCYCGVCCGVFRWLCVLPWHAFSHELHMQPVPNYPANICVTNVGCILTTKSILARWTKKSILPRWTARM